MDFMYNSTNLREAATDLRHLLNRGYSRKSAIDLVGNRWNLDREERHILYRAIFSNDEIKARQWNEIFIEEITDKTIAIDTYNILITIESFLKGLQTIYADDQYLRDISKVSSKYRESEYTLQVIQLILKKLKPYHPKNLLFFLDKDISHSGELAGLIQTELNKLNLSGNAETVPSSDKAVVSNGEIVISNDRIVLENAMAHLNLTSLIIKDFEETHPKPIRLM